MLSDTIAAISTATGEAAISVIRLSGSKALAIASKAFKLPAKVVPRRAHLVQVLDENGAGLDSGVLLHLQREDALDNAQAGELLNDRSGLLGAGGGNGEHSKRRILGVMAAAEAEGCINLDQDEITISASSKSGSPPTSKPSSAASPV
jgi:tRNA modification GTPase